MMKFVWNFYILLLFTKRESSIQCSGDFENVELQYLSRKLNPLECVRLINLISMETTSKGSGWEKEIDRKTISGDENDEYLGPENCLLNLQQWNDHFPGKTDKINDRSTMEMALQELGRLDLARYVKRNDGVIKFLASLTDYDLNDHSRDLNYEDLQRRWNLRSDRSTAKAEETKKKRTGKHKPKFNQKKSTGNTMNGQTAMTTGQVKSKIKIVRKKESSESSVAQKRPSDSKAIIAVTLGLGSVLICILMLLFIHKYRKRKCRIQLSGNWGNKNENNGICCDCCGCKRQLNQKICAYSCNTDNENEGKWSRCTSGCCNCCRKMYCQPSQTFSDVCCKEELSMASLPRYKDNASRKDKRRRIKKRKRRRLGSFESEKKSRSNKRDKDQINYKRKCFKKVRVERGRREDIRENSMSDVSDVSILAQSAKEYDWQEPRKIYQKKTNMFGTSYPQCGCCKCAFISEGTMT